MKKVGIISPSGCIENPEKLEIAAKKLETLGIGCKIFPSCYKTFRYMAGDDKTRLKDLHLAYLDSTIDTIICARGGYGAIRLLDKIDYSIIKNNPKKFVGSSDITALLISIFNKTGQITYHAKMALNGVSEMDDEEFLKYNKAILENSYNLPEFKGSNPKGVLWGGNLATIVSMIGGDFVPKEDIILFLEDINEPDYKIDRMLTQILRYKPLCDRIKGIIFGEFIGAGKFLDEILAEFANSLNLPYSYDKNITHGPMNTVVPIGKKF